VPRLAGVVDDVQEDAVEADSDALPGQGHADADLSAADADHARAPWRGGPVAEWPDAPAPVRSDLE
jgi:hypothetical protein